MPPTEIESILHPKPTEIPLRSVTSFYWQKFLTVIKVDICVTKQEYEISAKKNFQQNIYKIKWSPKTQMVFIVLLLVYLII